MPRRRETRDHHNDLDVNDAAPAAQTLTSEFLSTPSDALITSGACVSSGDSTFGFSAGGTAAGSCPGTFTEAGSVTIRAQPEYDLEYETTTWEAACECGLAEPDERDLYFPWKLGEGHGPDAFKLAYPEFEPPLLGGHEARVKLVDAAPAFGVC